MEPESLTAPEWPCNGGVGGEKSNSQGVEAPGTLVHARKLHPGKKVPEDDRKRVSKRVGRQDTEAWKEKHKPQVHSRNLGTG